MFTITQIDSEIDGRNSIPNPGYPRGLVVNGKRKKEKDEEKDEEEDDDDGRQAEKRMCI